MEAASTELDTKVFAMLVLLLLSEVELSGEFEASIEFAECEESPRLALTLVLDIGVVNSEEDE